MNLKTVGRGINEGTIMKKLLLPFILLVSIFVSCSEDKDTIIENPVQEGEEINFGAGLSTVTQSRTEYGDYTPDAGLGYFPVNWIHTDKIAIYCPQASNPANKYAKYKIMASTPASNLALGVERIGDCGLQWGSEDIHEFYGVYPAELVPDDVSSKPSFLAEMPQSQSASEQVTDAEGNVTLKPNMHYALMAAYNTVSKSAIDQTQAIPMSFKPLASVLDITVDAPADAPAKISSIRITARKKGLPVSITGAFHVIMDTKTKGVKCQVFDNSKVANVITLNMPEGELVLQPGKQLNAKAFLIPDKEQLKGCEFEISVNIAQGTNTKTFTNKQIQVEPHKVFRVKLPSINTKVSPEFWMTKLDPNVYLTELSVPGSKMSVLTPDNGSDIAYQTVNIAQQYKAGVRAFILCTHVRVNQQVKKGDKNSEKLSYEMHVRCQGKSIKPLKKALEEIAGYLKKSEEAGKREYAFVMITYESDGFSASPRKEWKSGIFGKGEWVQNKGVTFAGQTPGGLPENQRWLRTLQQEVNEMKGNSKYRIFTKPVTANTVLGDVANQIVLKANTNIDNMEKGYESGKNKQAPMLFSFWKSAYEPTYSTGVALGWGKPVFHDAKTELKWLYQEVTHVGTEVPDLATKVTAMKTVFEQSLKQYHADNSHSTWFMNDLGGVYVSGNNSRKLAIDMNKAARKYLSGRADDANASLGLVFMNFADRDPSSGADPEIQSDIMIQNIIDNNFKFGLRKKSGNSVYSVPSRSLNADPNSWDE